jgi:hypothetical protein
MHLCCFQIGCLIAFFPLLPFFLPPNSSSFLEISPQGTFLDRLAWLAR